MRTCSGLRHVSHKKDGMTSIRAAIVHAFSGDKLGFLCGVSRMGDEPIENRSNQSVGYSLPSSINDLYILHLRD